MNAKTSRFSLLELSVLLDLVCSNVGLSGSGFASGRLEGRRLEGKMDRDVTVALLLAELLETLETVEMADDGGVFFLDTEDFLE